MFTYVIAQRHQREIRARLVYDGKVVNGAIAEGKVTHIVQSHICYCNRKLDCTNRYQHKLCLL